MTFQEQMDTSTNFKQGTISIKINLNFVGFNFAPHPIMLGALRSIFSIEKVKEIYFCFILVTFKAKKEKKKD